jgi:CRISPR-associated protein Cas1
MSDPIGSKAPELELDVPRAKTLPLRLPLAADAPDPVPARMVNEVLYCERLMYLEWAQGEWADNAFTVDGKYAHRRADEPSGDLPPIDGGGDRPYVARSLWLTSERLGVTAKIDVVEGDVDGTVVPIEYKRGTMPDVPEGAHLPERAQLCAQVLVLRDHGYRCDEAAMYFAGSRRRVSITIDDALVATTMAAIARATELRQQGKPPPPLQNSPKCDGCSLVGICLPDETNLLRESPPEQTREFDAEPAPMRRLHPSRDDRLPLYVQEQGARIGIDGEVLTVKGKEGATQARLANTSQVSIYGNVQVSTQAMRTLAERNVPLFFFSYGGWFTGRLVGLDSKNVELRIAQHRAAADVEHCLGFARGIVASKIRNARTMLRRNHASPDPVVLKHLEQLAVLAEQCGAIDSLLGIEGTAARDYFGAFTGMLKGNAATSKTFDLEGRNRRPPRDPINALLSFTYGLLAKDLVLALTSAGLDPMVGFYHQPRFGRPGLALDLMEELRPIVADSVVLGAINNDVVDDRDFTVRASGVALTAPARKKIIAAYERRMSQEITHPVFGYTISYRRVLEVQARLLGRVLLGEIERYPAFRTR